MFCGPALAAARTAAAVARRDAADIGGFELVYLSVKVAYDVVCDPNSVGSIFYLLD